MSKAELEPHVSGEPHLEHSVIPVNSVYCAKKPFSQVCRHRPVMEAESRRSKCGKSTRAPQRDHLKQQIEKVSFFSLEV